MHSFGGHNDQKTKSFASGVFLLTLASAVSKVCGMLYKLPLARIVGEEGMGYFGSAYVIYTFFFVLTTSGLPLGLSIPVSGAADEWARRAYLRTALLLFGGFGAAVGILMGLFPRTLAEIVGNPGARPCIAAMAPGLAASCMAGALRGYWQGKREMLPTALSQTIESVGKTLFGLTLAYRAARGGASPAVCASMALWGMSAAGILSLVYLLLRLLVETKREGSVGLYPTRRHARAEIRRVLLSSVIPVSAASAVMSVSSLVDLFTVMHGLSSAGLSPSAANAAFGVYSGMALPVFNLPAVLIQPIASSLVPHLSRAVSSGEAQSARQLSGNALRLCLLVSLPCAAGLGILSNEILRLLFLPSSAKNAAPLLTLLSPAVPLVALSTVGGALLQARGRKALPLFAVASGALGKCVCAALLIPRIGIPGAAVGTVVCYAVSATVILLFCARHRLLPDIRGLRPVRILFCAGLCASTAFLSRRFCRHGTAVPTLCAVALSAAVYILSCFLCGACRVGEIAGIFGKNERTTQSERKSTGASEGAL